MLCAASIYLLPFSLVRFFCFFWVLPSPTPTYTFLLQDTTACPLNIQQTQVHVYPTRSRSLHILFFNISLRKFSSTNSIFVQSERAKSHTRPKTHTLIYTKHTCALNKATQGSSRACDRAAPFGPVLIVCCVYVVCVRACFHKKSFVCVHLLSYLLVLEVAQVQLLVPNGGGQHALISANVTSNEVAEGRNGNVAGDRGDVLGLLEAGRVGH